MCRVYEKVRYYCVLLISIFSFEIFVKIVDILKFIELLFEVCRALFLSDDWVNIIKFGRKFYVWVFFDLNKFFFSWWLIIC